MLKYYINAGYSPSDLGTSVHLPNNANSTILCAKVIIFNGNSIRTTTTPRNNVYGKDRERFIELLNDAVKNPFFTYTYDTSLSNCKYDVYVRTVAPSVFGVGTSFYIAISKDKKTIIEWEKGNEDRRNEFCEIKLNDLLPKAPNHDFLL